MVLYSCIWFYVVLYGFIMFYKASITLYMVMYVVL